MTSVNTGLNPYAQFGSAYARAAATQPSLANALNAAESGSQPDVNAATNLTLSDAARAQLANVSTLKDFTTVTADARTALELALFRPTRCAVYGDVAARLKRPLVPGPLLASGLSLRS